jgi:hypothetical protein
MATDIELVQDAVTAARRDVERIARQCVSMDDTHHLRELLIASRSALELSEFLLAESRSAEKFWQVRRASGL